MIIRIDPIEVFDSKTQKRFLIESRRKGVINPWFVGDPDGRGCIIDSENVVSAVSGVVGSMIQEWRSQYEKN